MQLLVCVVNREKDLDGILAGFVELGITGATVIGSEGMGRLVDRGLPVMAGLQSLIDRSRIQNTTVLSVLEDDQVETAVAMIAGICGDLERPGTGIVFTVPVTKVVGLAPGHAAEA